VKLGDLGDFAGNVYTLKARFTSSSGLKEGANVELAGVVVGKVKRIELDPEDYTSIVEFSLPRSVQVQDDAIVSVRSTGLIGGKFLKIAPGGSDEILAPGDELSETEPSISLEELIGKYIFQSQGED
jgi:phospholipid/cholesterol/gamma-HCH transport system substrate-binding protein